MSDWKPGDKCRTHMGRTLEIVARNAAGGYYATKDCATGEIEVFWQGDLEPIPATPEPETCGVAELDSSNRQQLPQAFPGISPGGGTIPDVSGLVHDAWVTAQTAAIQLKAIEGVLLDGHAEPPAPAFGDCPPAGGDREGNGECELMDNEQTVTDERLHEILHKPVKDLSLGVVEMAAIVRELQRRRASDAQDEQAYADTQTLRAELDAARAKLESAKVELAETRRLLPSELLFSEATDRVRIYRTVTAKVTPDGRAIWEPGQWRANPDNSIPIGSSRVKQESKVVLLEGLEDRTQEVA